MKKALLIVNVQNDYFKGGTFHLWDAEKTLDNILSAIEICKSKNYPVIIIQHIEGQSAPFLKKDSYGVKVVDKILKAAPDAPVIINCHADSFVKTDLNKILEKFDIDELLVCGMMTQDSVTHTAISNKKSKNYKTFIIKDACTSVSEILHVMALHANSTWVDLISFQEI